MYIYIYRPTATAWGSTPVMSAPHPRCLSRHALEQARRRCGMYVIRVLV